MVANLKQCGLPGRSLRACSQKGTMMSHVVLEPGWGWKAALLEPGVLLGPEQEAVLQSHCKSTGSSLVAWVASLGCQALCFLSQMWRWYHPTALSAW